MKNSVLHDVLEIGVESGASDWHIREGCPVGLRISGDINELDFVTDHAYMKEIMDTFLSADLRREFNETGDADFAIKEEDVGRFRANLHRERGRLALTLRHIRSKVPSVESLCLPKTILKLAERKRGIIFVSGMTGSGKSTTLACMVEHINRSMPKHIVSLEDPIEYTFEDNLCIVEQREIGVDVKTFESGLSHVLRQDPDIILLGEMRDTETFETALVAAETGHLVLTTLHAKNASQSIHRILDMYSPAKRDAIRISMSQNIQGIVCQRLLPRATGEGMVPCLEIMVNNPTISKLIHENKIGSIFKAIEGGKEEGMVSFNRSLLNLINDGMISEEEGLAAADNPEALRMNLQGIFLSSGEGGIVE